MAQKVAITMLNRKMAFHKDDSETKHTYIQA